MKTLHPLQFGFLIFITNLFVSQPLLARDAQTANKPDDMLILFADTTPCPASGNLGYLVSHRLMDDGTKAPYTTPAGHKLVITSTSSTQLLLMVTPSPNWVLLSQGGLLVDVALTPDMQLCTKYNTDIVTGHLEKDLP